MSTDKEKFDRNRDDVQWVLSTEQGRRFLWRMLTYCGVHHDIGGPMEQVYKDLGKRNVGLHLEGLIVDADESRLFDMMKEAKNRAIEEKEHDDRINRDKTERTINTVDGLIHDDSGDQGGLPGYATSAGPVF